MKMPKKGVCFNSPFGRLACSSEMQARCHYGNLHAARSTGEMAFGRFAGRLGTTPLGTFATALEAAMNDAEAQGLLELQEHPGLMGWRRSLLTVRR